MWTSYGPLLLVRVLRPFLLVLCADFGPDGLKETQSSGTPFKAAGGKKKGKRNQARSRQFKQTNTHLKGLVDLSRDYVAPK
jgi:hypothetical protein